MNSRNDTESTMLHSATPCSSENTEVISGRDDKGLSVDHVEESDNPADVVREAVIPSKSTLPASATDDSGLSKPVEVATTLNDESAPITSTSSDGNNEIVLTFPQRLMDMLDDPQNAEMMAWLPHGRAFAIYRKREFASDVLPKYFQKAAKYSSFTRKLNRWGFIRVTRGPETGAYYHPLFRRNERRLVLQMTCHTATSTNSDSSNPNNTAGAVTTSKRVSGSTHASVENESMSMMMYPNYLDPAATQFMYHHNPFAGPGQPQHPSQYPQMDPHSQHYHSGAVPPYNTYEDTPVDGVTPEERLYYQYPPAMGGAYPNHYPIPQPHGPFMDLYSQAPYHGNNKTFDEANVRPYGDTTGHSRRMSGMAERVESSSQTASMISTVEDEGKSNYRMATKGLSSFHSEGRHDTGYHPYYHHHPPGHSGREDDVMMYHPPHYDNGVSYDNGDAADESERLRHAPRHNYNTGRNNVEHSLYSPAVEPSSPYSDATHPPL